MDKNRRPVGPNAARCAALLVLLAVCSVFGRPEEEPKLVSVPVTAVAVGREAAGELTMLEARERLNRQRMEEMAMLDEVLGSHTADGQIHSTALAQKMQLAQRMEKEAQAEAALAFMGFGGTAVVCSAQGATILAPYAYIRDEAQRIRMIDCVCMQTGISADCVKIILAKNE